MSTQCVCFIGVQVEIASDSVASDPAGRVAGFIHEAKRVVVLTGAGMSAESGVPTFRDALSGYWAKYDPQELATPEAFRRQPATVFGWYVDRTRAVMAARPHPGYHALVEIESAIGALPVVTQNVDGLHRRAGSSDVTELHGSLTAFRCVGLGHGFPLESILALGSPKSGKLEPPACEICGQLIRPGAVWFGEVLPADALERAHELAETADVVLVVGTSSVIYPAAGLPERARARGATVVEINPERTPFTEYAALSWRTTAGNSLPAVADRLMI